MCGSGKHLPHSNEFLAGACHNALLYTQVVRQYDRHVMKRLTEAARITEISHRRLQYHLSTVWWEVAQELLRPHLQARRVRTDHLSVEASDFEPDFRRNRRSLRAVVEAHRCLFPSSTAQADGQAAKQTRQERWLRMKGLELYGVRKSFPKQTLELPASNTSKKLTFETLSNMLQIEGIDGRWVAVDKKQAHRTHLVELLSVLPECKQQIGQYTTERKSEQVFRAAPKRLCATTPNQHPASNHTWPLRSRRRHRAVGG